MPLSSENKRSLFNELHLIMEGYAASAANGISLHKLDNLVSYPPGEELSGEEIKALEMLKGNEPLRTALIKVLAANTADVLFSLFNLIDGTTDPEGKEGWTGVMLVDKPVHPGVGEEFLHDAFLESYHEWKKG